MNENRWSPFDPEWYQYAFDKFIATADQLFNQDEIISQGYVIPDSDGSKSSVFRKSAVLNNTFNEKMLRETLKDIYLNSSHKLTASNHDNVHFFKWFGTMEDVTLVANSGYCDILIPTENIIEPNLREKYKRSQFYRKWVTDTELLQNWDTFKWGMMLFINQRVHSGFKFRIDDQTFTIRFDYKDFWVEHNYPIYLFKFDTLYQSRIKIAAETVANENRWDWKVPMHEFYGDEKIANHTNVIAYFNRISDSDVRADGKTNVDPMGDNIEFLTVEDGSIDISKISEFNKGIIQSEYKEWVYMTICVPKFLYEFPILTVTDVVYRPYMGKYSKVFVLENGSYSEVKADLDSSEQRNVMVNLADNIEDWDDGWKYVIRPMVLSDSFEISEEDMYLTIRKEIDALNLQVTSTSDAIDGFRAVARVASDEEFDEQCGILDSAMTTLYDKYNEFLEAHNVDANEEYESLMDEYKSKMVEVRTDKQKYSGFRSQHSKHSDFWSFLSDILQITRDLIDRYNVAYTVKNIQHPVMFEETLPGKLRFNHPIDASDIWSFQYYPDEGVWRPCILEITRHFPDVYTFNDGVDPTPNTIYKNLFFYSDTMNIRNKAPEIRKATPSWNDDMEAYMYNRGSVYRDTFMEKFYWMGIRSIYSGITSTDYKWEILEYIQNNSSYERFNQLFLNTMDPYFKMGLATYLKSDNYEFPFDNAVSKLNESINSKFLGYQRVTNYEMYLNKTWIPSYFDYVVDIIDNWDYGDRLIKRPGASFNVPRLLDITTDIQHSLNSAISILDANVNTSIDALENDGYHLQQEYLNKLLEESSSLKSNMENMISFTENLDSDIFSISDVDKISSMMQGHLDTVEDVRGTMRIVYNNAMENSVYGTKKECLTKLNDIITRIVEITTTIKYNCGDFDIDFFMKRVNNPDYFDEYEHEDDSSLIGRINQFLDPWNGDVQDLRSKLYADTVILWGKFTSGKQFTITDISEISDMIKSVLDTVKKLRALIYEAWDVTDDSQLYSHDLVLVSHLDFAEEYLESHIGSFELYEESIVNIREYIDSARSVLLELENIGLTDTEESYVDIIDDEFTNLFDELSYLDTNSHQTKVDNIEESINDAMIAWESFNGTEAQIFEDIIAYTKDPAPFLVEVDSFKEQIVKLIEYIATYDVEFVPDSSLPTYSDIYKANEIEIVNAGFGHKVDELVFIPQVGLYKISKVDDVYGECLELEDISDEDVNFTFRDPVSDTKQYYASTNGNGLGIVVKVNSSIHKRIINDSITESYVRKIDNVVYMSKRDAAIINPYNNGETESVIDSISKITDDWDDLLTFYTEYMSTDRTEFIQKIMDSLHVLSNELTSFTTGRSMIDLYGFLNNLFGFITSCYSYYEEAGKISANYIYFDARLRTVYNALSDYYGDGTSWNESQPILDCLDDIQYELELFNRMIIKKFTPEAHAEDINNRYEELFRMMDSIRSSIDTVLQLSAEIVSTSDSISEMTSNIPEAQVDKWYKVSTMTIPDGGNDYTVGDIVKLECDDYPLYAQVTNVYDDGRTYGTSLLLNYALPSQIYGTFQTSSQMVEEGSGMLIGIMTSVLDKYDSLYFMDKSSDLATPEQFSENDLMAFKFANVYDLPVDYEIYYGGKQITDFITRHENSNSTNTTDLDIVYLRANDVYDLSNSSITEEGESYFIYKIDDVEVVDSGSGYEEGQEVIVGTDQAVVHLTVDSLNDNPLKEIASVDIVQSSSVFNGVDPAATEVSAIDDTLNNIDDEYNDGRYSQLTKEGVITPLAQDLPEDEYNFVSKRYDDMDDGLRNTRYMYRSGDLPEGAPEGDPDYHNYLGSRVDNSQVPYEDDHRYDGMIPVIPHMDPFIPDSHRVPGDDPFGEYQLIERAHIHHTSDESSVVSTSDTVNVNGEDIKRLKISGVEHIRYNLQTASDEGDSDSIEVATFVELPQHIDEWSGVHIGSKATVDTDESKNGHRVVYTVLTFNTFGFIIYDDGEYADYKWSKFVVDWMESDWAQDIPSLKAQYPSANWDTDTYASIYQKIKHGDIPSVSSPQRSTSTYIHDITIEDISVYNYTAHQWEDLSSDKWTLITNDDGFVLEYADEGMYSYDMGLFLNKVSSTQTKNANIKRNAKFNISSYIIGEVDKKTKRMSVNTGRALRIRKLFPFEQNESYTIKNGEEMTFKIANYMHFKNELHLQDVNVFNKTAGRFEDIFDQNMFEIQFKDPKAVQRGMETQTSIVNVIISDPGEGFTSGDAWAINEEYGIHVFGEITVDNIDDGYISKFTPVYCPSMPSSDISVEFQVYQHYMHWNTARAQIIVEFHTDKVEVRGNGYLRNVNNRLAPLPKEFKVIPKYTIDDAMEYEISINKTPQKWTFIKDKWEVFPTFELPNIHIPQSRLYILIDRGRIPLTNPSTGKPSFDVTYTDTGTNVRYLNLYHKYEKLEIHAVPYPMRSVYVKRRVPSNGYIDLDGKLNKPLDKKYFEFWMNGRLLSDEVTIISPTKIFLHGLTSLRNFEIVEINRDINEYFSSNFLTLEKDLFTPYPKWDFTTYLDDALAGTIDGDNYTVEEQESLLTPAWKQVEREHPEFKNYPPNVDIENDILTRADVADAVQTSDDIPYQFVVIDPPEIESVPINSRMIKFEDFGFIPLSDDEICSMLDEEWAEEIEEGLIPSHVSISDNAWYGIATRMYDAYGKLVDNLSDAVYIISDPNILRIDTDTRIGRIIKSDTSYDLS